MSLQSKWAEVEKEQVEFVDRLTNETLQQMLPFRTTRASLAHLMQHLANHSTYHRGQIAVMMRQLGAEPLAADFHEFLVDGAARLRLRINLLKKTRTSEIVGEDCGQNRGLTGLFRGDHPATARLRIRGEA
jgi:hypothetical protein